MKFAYGMLIHQNALDLAISVISFLLNEHLSEDSFVSEVSILLF